MVAPGTPADAYGLLKAAVRDPDPVMFFEHKKTYRLFKAEVPDDADGLVPIGSAVVARPGSDLSIFCYGYMRYCALEAAETLAQDGIEAEVVDLRTLPSGHRNRSRFRRAHRAGARGPRGEPVRRFRGGGSRPHRRRGVRQP